MRNLWIQTESAFATWVADLEPLRGRPSALLSVADAILSAGARHRVFSPVELPALDYHRGLGSPLFERLLARWEERRVIDLFAFTAAAMMPGGPGSSTVEATMAWYDRSDALVEAPVVDLGAVLRSLEPVPGFIPDGFTAPFPPLRITGPELQYDKLGTAPVGASERRAACVRFAIHSDIWFPYVFGSAHPLADHRRMFDNRALASRHTPRLDAFLVEVGDAVTAAGGRWYVDPADTGTNAILWLDERGILVEAPEPPLLPPDALEAEWY